MEVSRTKQETVKRYTKILYSSLDNFFTTKCNHHIRVTCFLSQFVVTSKIHRLRKREFATKLELYINIEEYIVAIRKKYFQEQCNSLSEKLCLF